MEIQRNFIEINRKLTSENRACGGWNHVCGSCTNKEGRKSIYSNLVLVHIPTAKSPRALLARQLQHNILVDYVVWEKRFGINQPVAPHSTTAVLRHHPDWQHQRTRCILSHSAQKLLHTTFHPEFSSSKCQSIAIAFVFEAHLIVDLCFERYRVKDASPSAVGKAASTVVGLMLKRQALKARPYMRPNMIERIKMWLFSLVMPYWWSQGHPLHLHIDWSHVPRVDSPAVITRCTLSISSKSVCLRNLPIHYAVVPSAWLKCYEILSSTWTVRTWSQSDASILSLCFD